MSRGIANVLTQSFTCAYPSGLTFPFTMFCLVKPQSVTDGKTIMMALSANGTAGEFHALALNGTAAATGSGFACRSAIVGTDKESFLGHTPSSTDVVAVCGVWSSSSNRLIYVNGTAGTANTSVLAPTCDRFDIGARFDGGSHQEGCTAQIEMPCVWDVALTAEQILSISQDPSGAGDGPWPLPWEAIRPLPVWFSPFEEVPTGISSAFYDWRGGTTITPVNNPRFQPSFPVGRSVAA